MSQQDMYLAEKSQDERREQLSRVAHGQTGVEFAARRTWLLLRAPLRLVGLGLMAMGRLLVRTAQTPTTEQTPMRLSLQYPTND